MTKFLTEQTILKITKNKKKRPATNPPTGPARGAPVSRRGSPHGSEPGVFRRPRRAGAKAREGRSSFPDVAPATQRGPSPKTVRTAFPWHRLRRERGAQDIRPMYHPNGYVPSRVIYVSSQKGVSAGYPAHGLRWAIPYRAVLLEGRSTWQRTGQRSAMSW